MEQEQKQHKQNKNWLPKKVMVGIVAIGIGSVILFPKPSLAFLDDIVSIFEDLEQYFPEVAIVNEWLDIISSTIANPCSGVDIIEAVPIESGLCTAVEDAINGDFTTIIETAMGELGVPSPLEVQQKIKEQALEGNVSDNPFVDNPHTFLEFKQNINDRTLTKLHMETVMGETGQDNREQAMEIASEKANNIADEAESAQSLTSTQDVLKALVKIKSMEVAIDQLYLQDQYTARNDQQFTNLNLTNISRTLDEDSKREILNRKGNAARTLYWSSQLSLF